MPGEPYFGVLSQHPEVSQRDVFDEFIQRGFVLTSGVVVHRACLDDVADFDRQMAGACLSVL